VAGGAAAGGEHAFAFAPDLVAGGGMKACFVVLTFAGFASLWGANRGNMGASLLVIFNALRLLGPVGVRT
jgi:cation transport ATPase